MKKGKAIQKTDTDRGIPEDKLIDLEDSIESLSADSQSIHDMVEHINKHLEKCKSIYNISKEKEEMEKIGTHILNVDKKMHQLMEHIEGFGKLAQGMGLVPSSSKKNRTPPEKL